MRQCAVILPSSSAGKSNGKCTPMRTPHPEIIPVHGAEPPPGRTKTHYATFRTCPGPLAMLLLLLLPRMIISNGYFNIVITGCNCSDELTRRPLLRRTQQ